MTTLFKELSNTELIEMYKSNSNPILKKELIYRAKNQKPLVYSDGTKANCKLVEFVKSI